MGNLARKIQQERTIKQHTVRVPKKVKKQKLQFSPIEKLLGFTFCVGLMIGGIQVISNQAEIYEINKNIHETSILIEEQIRVNRDLKNQVEELSTYERIVTKAKELGLKLNENNVKVVHD